MKALAKLLADFVTWRWAPTVGLVSAAVLFVLFVVGVIPSEIEVPIANTRFVPKPVSTVTTSTASMDTDTEPVRPASMEPAPIVPAARLRATDFGRRGFSPPLERPEAPPAPPPPPPRSPDPEPVVAVDPPPPVPAAPPMRSLAGRMNGLMQTMTRVLPGAEAQAPPAPPAEPPAGAQPPAADAPAQGAPPDAGAPESPNGAPAPAPPDQPN